jgi:type I restriction enzyme M protein
MTNQEKVKQLEEKLWKAASHLWAHGSLKPTEYTFPILGIIFLKFADTKQKKIEQEYEKSDMKDILSIDEFVKSAWWVYLSENARYDYLLSLPESENIGEKLNQAMEEIEKYNEKLVWIMPKNYESLTNENLVNLLKIFSEIPQDLENDAFGQIYEYFMSNFEKEAWQKWWEFYTPNSIVKLIVEIIQPHRWKIFDPACGSGGMFVQTANYLKKKWLDPLWNLKVAWQELKSQTIKIAKMNLAINGIDGQIKEANSLYEDKFDSIWNFDYVMANPPFNVDNFDSQRLINDKRYLWWIPSTRNANYLWIQIFYSALNQTWRAGFVMANSAMDARHSELEIRKKLIESKVVDVMISVGPNFFYTVTLPCSLWFFDKWKIGTDREDKILFIDAKEIFHQIDRAHREFTPEQIEFIADIVRLYRWEDFEIKNEETKKYFPDGKYQDIAWLCKIASLDEVKENGYSLNPWRYVGVKQEEELSDEDFKTKLKALTEEFEELSKQAHKLEEDILENVKGILG